MIESEPQTKRGKTNEQQKKTQTYKRYIPTIHVTQPNFRQSTHAIKLYRPRCFGRCRCQCSFMLLFYHKNHLFVGILFAQSSYI